jgi:hypothetical protein
MQAEGWYVDPYARHDQRWFSNGVPTKLVKDDGVESNDQPPDRPSTGPLEPIGVEVGPGADDFAHRDVDESAGHSGDGGDIGVAAAWEAFVETGGD